MNVLLALFCVFLFVLSLPLNYFNHSKLMEKMIIDQKRIKNAREARKKAQESFSFSDEVKAMKEYNSATEESLPTLITSCFVSLLSLALVLGEIIVIVSALTLHLGVPLFGFIALGLFILILFYDIFISPKIRSREEANAKRLGNVYIPKTNILRQIIGWIPDVYALYIFLVIIGVLL